MVKNLQLLAIFFLLSIVTVQASCEVSLLDSQEKINNFASNYSNCTVVSNKLEITGADITNLDGLAGITEVGELRIKNNPLLANLSGLSSLVRAGYVNIENNASLGSLAGLGELTYAGAFRIVFNNALTTLAGAGKLTSVSGFLSVGVNPLLTDLSGLDNITSVLGDVSISRNVALVNLNGLQKLKSIGGYLNIASNPALTDISELINLESATNYITVHDNDALTSLSGLDNVDLKFVGYMRITDSANLSFCSLRNLCLYQKRLGITHISGNAAGCATKQEVVESSTCEQVLPVGLVNFSGKASVEGNKLTWNTSWEASNMGFSVEKSVNALHFEEIGFVQGAGDSRENNTYSFTDSKADSISYYRLKQIDHDLTSAYSKIIVVGKEQIKVPEPELFAYPNPSHGALYIKTDKPKIAYSILSLSGKMVQEGVIVAGKPIETKGLQNGFYLIRVGDKVVKIMVNN